MGLIWTETFLRVDPAETVLTGHVSRYHWTTNLGLGQTQKNLLFSRFFSLATSSLWGDFDGNLVSESNGESSYLWWWMTPIVFFSKPFSLSNLLRSVAIDLACRFIFLQSNWRASSSCLLCCSSSSTCFYPFSDFSFSIWCSR